MDNSAHSKGSRYAPGKFDLPWTASRCRRLLRPLQARITTLRKIAQEGPSKAGSVAYCAGVTLGENLFKKRIANPGAEGRQNKRLRRTYCQKRATSESDSTVTEQHPSRIRRSQRKYKVAPTKSEGKEVPTPLLRKVRQREMEVARAVDCGMEHRISDTLLSSALGSIRRTALSSALADLQETKTTRDATRHTVYEGMLRDLDALLESTRLQSSPTGPTSFLSMCLRKVPEHAAQVDANEMAEAQKLGLASAFLSSSALVRIYDELESMGGHGRGWKHLPIMAQAHGLWTLKEASAQGLLDHTFVSVLVGYYQARGCHRDASLLLETLVVPGRLAWHNHHDIHKSVPPRISSMIMSLVHKTSASPHLHHLLYLMVQGDQPPRCWLTTKTTGPNLCTLVSAALLEENTSPWALSFASTAVVWLCSASSHRCSNPETASLDAAEVTLIHTVGAMVAMALVSSGGFNRPKTPEGCVKETLFRRRVAHVLNTALSMATENGSRRIGRYILKLGILLSMRGAGYSTEGRRNDKALETAWNTAKSPIRLHDATTTLMCAVAHCAGRATSSPSSGYFAQLCARLESLGVPEQKKLRNEGAFLLAQKTNDLRDLAFAEATDHSATSRTASTTPSHKADGNQIPFTGYRWEEGISEWVIASPEMGRTTKKKAATHRSTRLHDLPGGSRAGKVAPPGTGRQLWDKKEHPAFEFPNHWRIGNQDYKTNHGRGTLVWPRRGLMMALEEHVDQGDGSRASQRPAYPAEQQENASQAMKGANGSSQAGGAAQDIAASRRREPLAAYTDGSRTYNGGGRELCNEDMDELGL